MFLECAMQFFLLRVVQPEIEYTPSRPYACDDVRQRMRVGDPSPAPCHLKEQCLVAESDGLPCRGYQVPFEKFAAPSIRMAALKGHVHRVPSGAGAAKGAVLNARSVRRGQKPHTANTTLARSDLLPSRRYALARRAESLSLHSPHDLLYYSVIHGFLLGITGCQ